MHNNKNNDNNINNNFIAIVHACIRMSYGTCTDTISPQGGIAHTRKRPIAVKTMHAQTIKKQK